jgi:hypothetical protein
MTSTTGIDGCPICVYYDDVEFFKVLKELVQIGEAQAAAGEVGALGSRCRCAPVYQEKW